MEELKKECVCPNGCVEWQACSDCPNGVCDKTCCPEAVADETPLTPTESFIKAGGKTTYITVDEKEVDVPYMNDEVEIKVSSPNDIIFWDATLKITGMGAEGLHLYLDYLMKVMEETIEMMTERMDFFRSLVWDANKLVANGMKNLAAEKYPEFLELIQNDVAAKKEKSKKEWDDKLASLTPEQRENIQKMMESKTNLS